MMLRLRKGERYKKAKDFKPFVREQVVGSLCDAHGYHWDFEVLKAMEEDFFVGIMGVPNATGLWQVADIRNNGTL